MPTHQITITVWSDEPTPNWFVEKTITEAVEKVWVHRQNNWNVQAEVSSIIKVDTPRDPLNEFVDGLFKYFTG